MTDPNEFNDEFAGIFDDVTPDMFIAETSAVHEDEGSFVGTAMFNTVVDEALRGVRTAFASSFGQINPTAMLANATTRRFFAPEQDENLGQFLERLKREAMTMGAHWFFLAKRNVVAVWYEEDEEAERHDTGSDDAMRTAAMHGSEPEMGVLWYAERREGGETHHRHGVLKIEGHKITDATEGDDKQTIGVFSLILDAVRR